MSNGPGDDDEKARERNPAPVTAAGKPREPAAGEEGRDHLSSLLDAVGAVARADEAEMAAFPAEEVPPLSADSRDHMVARMLAARMRPETGEQARATGAIPMRRTTRRRAVIAAACSLSAAAALLVWIKAPSNDLALPGYTISAEGGVKDVRGGTTDTGGDDPTR